MTHDGSPPDGRARVAHRTWGSRRGLIVVSTALMISHQAGEALVPIVIGAVIDRAIATGDGDALVAWILALVGVFVLLSLSFRNGARIGVRGVEEAAHDLRVDVAARALHPRGGLHGHRSGALVALATTDARAAASRIAAIAFIASSFTAVTVAAAALVWISVPLALVVVVGALVALGALHRLSRPLERRSEDEQAEAARAASVVADLVSGLRVLKGIGAEAAAADRYRAASRRASRATVRAADAEAAHQGLSEVLTGLFLAVVALLAGRLAASGSISVGELVAALGLAQFLLGPLSQLAPHVATLARSRSSAKRIADVLARPFALAGGTAALPGDLKGEVVLDDVSLGPLRGLTLHVPAGEHLGIAVADSSMADALLDAIGRRADPDAGRVTIDGCDLRSIDPARLSDAVTVVGHDSTLFEGTIADNLGTTSDAALVASGADEILALTDDGDRRAVTSQGRSLSGGQRQRIALGRALSAERAVLVLHDPTTAVDAVTEARIAAGIRAFRRGRTTIVITTSPALLAAADRVALVVRDGTGATSVRLGDHGSLARHDAAYRDLVLS